MNDFLVHYGVKGQSWGVRRYQNEDGTLTEEGKEHYGISENEDKKQVEEPINKEVVKENAQAYREAFDQSLKNELGRDARRFAYGYLAKNVGALMRIGGTTPAMRRAGACISTFGKWYMYGTAFRATAQTGAYFLGKHLVNKEEKRLLNHT